MLETILLTGFGPFGTHERNISGEAVAKLDGQERDGFIIRTLTLPVHFEKATQLLEEAMATPPAAWIGCGIHSDPEGSFRIELAAKNERHYPQPDADGVTVVDDVVEADGPAMVFSTLPVSAIRRSWDEAGLDVELSDDAGRYLCNAVFYWGARRITPAGFLHVPADAEVLDQVCTALDRALDATVERLLAQRVEATA